jgi:hypothetical protein
MVLLRLSNQSCELEAHEVVSTLFAQDGVPNAMVMDGAREQTLGNFRKKCREASCHIKQMEPHSLWMNTAENGIQELKKASTRQMLKKHSPTRDHGTIVWSSKVRLHPTRQATTSD